MKVNELSYDLKVNGSSTNVVNVGARKTYIDVSITNQNPIDTKFVLTFTANFIGATESLLKYYPDMDMPYGTIKAGETKNIKICVFCGGWYGIDKVTFKVYGGLLHNELDIPSSEKRVNVPATEYTESILNGTDPVLSSNLIPVNIADDGAVTKASIYEDWYEYSQKKWANAIVLFDKSTVYKDGQVIPESNIQSYFVWIPRYRYQIFNTGNYTSLGTLSSTAVQTINVVFENKSTAASNGSSVNAWLTHPAFTSFNSNGFWVGKFEPGYKGATSTTGAQQNNSSSSNLIIKPNVYSWRSIDLGYAFKVSYDYLRSDDSHMMKNTEWGAVAYLQHSSYGSRTSVRINNNTSCLTGYAAVSEPTCANNGGVSTSCNSYGTAASITKPYNTAVGHSASTTGNITGIYDMSGGSWEYVMGYNVLASNYTIGGNTKLTTLYSDFFTKSKWNKYYDKYETTPPSEQSFKNRILGDATGEMGPFATATDPDGEIARQRGSWYGDYAHFVKQSDPWFKRGGYYMNGSIGGIFSYFWFAGNEDLHYHTFRVVLTP